MGWLGKERVRSRAHAHANPLECAHSRPASCNTGVFNNRRVLHGREALAPGVTGSDGSTSRRELEGAYMEWDEIDSLLRLHGDGVGGVNMQALPNEPRNSPEELEPACKAKGTDERS